jgi:hypothetical protein
MGFGGGEGWALNHKRWESILNEKRQKVNKTILLVYFFVPPGTMGNRIRVQGVWY